MGKKRDSIRTLPSGQKAVHHPDDEMDLIPNARAVKRLASSQESTSAKVAELRDNAVRAAREKRESLEAGNAVPSDKRPI